MGALIAGVVIALVSVSGAIVTAVMARRSAQDATRVENHRSFRDDFVTYVDEMKEQVVELKVENREQRGEIDSLRQKVTKCEAERSEDLNRIRIIEARLSELGG